MPLIRRQTPVRVAACVLTLFGAWTSPAPLVYAAVQATGTRSVSANPLLGAWTLDLTRTHYGRGADPRLRETFVCTPTALAPGGGGGVSCTIRSRRRGEAREITGQFTAALDGLARPVAGMPGMDAVTLVPVPGVPGAIDATFSARGGIPVYAYRAFRTPEGRSLLIVAVHPVTRVVLTSVVVYDRVAR